MQTMTEKLQKANARIEELESKTSWTALTSEIVYRKVGTDVEMIITAGATDFSSAENISQGTLPERI